MTSLFHIKNLLVKISPTRHRLFDLAALNHAVGRQQHQQRPLTRIATTGSPQPRLNLPDVELDVDYLLNPDNLQMLRQNIAARGSDADIDLAHRLHSASAAGSEEEIRAQLVKCPNISHPEVRSLTEPKICFKHDFNQSSLSNYRSFEDLARILHGLRNQHVKHYCGDSTYYLTGVLAELEQALINWSVDHLVNQGFKLVSVPDILDAHIVERCGMNVSGERTQVYRLATKSGHSALSGTAEMALGGYIMGKRFSSLPVKLCAVSRCYRAEVGGDANEKGIYRVHQFYKVEMFIVTEGSQDASQEALHQIHAIERDMFDMLELAYRVLDMSPDELGDPAARKFDIEAWLPSKRLWGEISSCSDCTDYQARRLDVKDSSGRFCHTVNGTACAVPRTIIAICEQHQLQNGCVNLPKPLHKYMRGNIQLKGPPKKERTSMKYISSANFFEKSTVK